LFVEGGANPEEGLRLFSLIFGADHPFLILASKKHPATNRALIDKMADHFSVKLVSGPPKKQPSPGKPAAPDPDPPGSFAKPARKPLRAEFAFLDDSECPVQLKALISDKITANRRYIAAHDQLFNCTSKAEEFATVKELVENMIENRKIYEELKYYQDHRTILGIHPIFTEFNELKEIDELSAIELAEKKQKLDRNIWRVKDEIEKNKKPHLRIEREARRAKLERQRNETIRLIKLHKNQK